VSNNFELLSHLELVDDLFPPTSDVTGASEAYSQRPEKGRVPNGFAEAVNLVQRVFSTAPELVPHVVVFTGAQSGAGCSWVCARTSEALAGRLSGTVCVVDANLRAPAMHRYFRVENFCGLTQALYQDDPILNYVQEISGRKLWVLPSGPPSAEHPAPWASERLALRVAELRRQFTYVLIDCPATNLYADVTSLSPLADGAILVLEADFTRPEAALQAKNALVAAKFRLLGAALNKRSFPIPDFIYRKL
jgi:polysaccharide biosynthesis transport protein